MPRIRLTSFNCENLMMRFAFGETNIPQLKQKLTLVSDSQAADLVDEAFDVLSEDFQDKIIQATKDEYSDNSNSFLRDYWNVVIERLKKDIQEIGGVEEDEKGRKEVFMYDYSIEEYYKSISKVLDFNCEFVLDSSQPVGMRRKLVDTTNLEGLGWESRFSLNQGLEETYKYYLKLKSNEKI